MANAKKDQPTFYYVELSQEAYDLLAKGCRILNSMHCGDLDAIKEMVFAAIRKRTSKEVPEDQRQVVTDCILGLEQMGWNRPAETPVRMSDESDIYHDIADVLDRQKEILGVKSGNTGDPLHYCKRVPLIRILNAIEVSQKRNKPLKTFVDCYTNKRRI